MLCSSSSSVWCRTMSCTSKTCSWSWRGLQTSWHLWWTCCMRRLSLLTRWASCEHRANFMWPTPTIANAILYCMYICSRSSNLCWTTCHSQQDIFFDSMNLLTWEAFSVKATLAGAQWTHIYVHTTHACAHLPACMHTQYKSSVQVLEMTYTYSIYVLMYTPATPKARNRAL